MSYREPLTPFVVHVADPAELPVREAGEAGPERVVSARVIAAEGGRAEFEARTSEGEALFLCVEAAGEGVIRVRLAPDAGTLTLSSAATRLVEPEAWDGARVTAGRDRVVVDAGPVVAECALDPWRLRFTDAAGRVLVEENADESDVSERLRVLPLGRSRDAAGRVLAYHETFGARTDEHFFGLGEKFTEFDKRGQRVVSWNYDAFSSESERSYKNIPFYVSSRGYGVLVDSGAATEFDLCHSTHSCVQVVCPDDLLDYYVLAGPTVEEVVRRYHRLTGPPVVPPKWALGTWISTGFAETDQEATLAAARAIRARGLPCDVLHIDAHWQRAGLWSHLEWDEEAFPDPVAMLAETAAMGFKTCLWINPYISVHAEAFKEGDAKGYFLKRADGATYTPDVWHGYQPPCGIVDFTDPEATAWFQGMLRGLLEQGVSVFKSDFGEGVPVDAVAANGMDGAALHNVYSLLFNDAVADVTEAVNGHRVVWARSSFTGGQRHCGQWAGDTNATFSAMASTMRGGLSYAVSGVPFWSHDVGGFTGTPTPEVFARSAQFGALSPLIRFHGDSTRLPWAYGAAVETIVRDALSLRYRLMPYLYSQAVEARSAGRPLMRPLIMEALDEPGTWSADMEYLIGADLLVAPVTDPDGARTVYLPGTADWVDFWSGRVHRGGRHVRVAQPLERIPLFVRLGAVIPTVPAGQTVGSAPFADLRLEIWGEGDASTTVHDEDASATVTVKRTGDTVAVTTDGTLTFGAVVFHAVDGVTAPARATVDGRPVTLETIERGE